MTAAQTAAILVDLVRTISLKAIQKAKRGPKKPVPPRTRFKNRPHVSTKQLLDRGFRFDA